jgi:hypothetical protein
VPVTSSVQVKRERERERGGSAIDWGWYACRAGVRSADVRAVLVCAVCPVAPKQSDAETPCITSVSARTRTILLVTLTPYPYPYPKPSGDAPCITSVSARTRPILSTFVKGSQHQEQFV